MSLAFVVVGLLFWVLTDRDTSPRHKDRTVAQWFREYCRFYQDGRSDQSEEILHAEQALLTLGTNTVAYLMLNELAREKPYMWRTLARVENRLPAFLRQRWMEWESDWLARDSAAQNLFREIRPPGSIVLKLLETQSFSEYPKFYYAVWLASHCGEEKEMFLPYFVQALQSGDLMAQSLALNSLVQIGPEMPGILPHLLNADLYANHHIRWLNALQSFGPDAAVIIPALKECFRNELNSYRKLRLAKMLCLIDPDPQEAFVFFETNIAFPKVEEYGMPARIRDAVFPIVSEIGPKARPLVPALLARLEAEDIPYLRLQVLQTLRAVEADPAIVLPIVHQHYPVLPTLPAMLRLAEEVLAMEPGNPDAIRMLMNVLTHSSRIENRSRALLLLGQQGAAAECALPLIRKCLPDPQLESIARVAFNLITRSESN
jgi:hypothetical protein